MHSTNLQLSPYAQLTYVIPTGYFDVQSDADSAAMHILEHWILEGGDNYIGSDVVFAAARELGGTISATISRKSVEIKLTFIAAKYDDARTFITEIVAKPRFDPRLFAAQQADVVGELDNDHPTTQLFDDLYAGIFTGRYALSGGGTVMDAQQLTCQQMQPYLAAYRQARGIMVWSGPENLRPIHDNSADNQEIRVQFVTPTLSKTALPAYENVDTGLLLLDTQAPLIDQLIFGEYLHVKLGNRAWLHIHVLPDITLCAVTFDRPDIHRDDISKLWGNFCALSDAEKQPYQDLAKAQLTDEYTYPSGASRISIDRLINADYNAAVSRLLVP